MCYQWADWKQIFVEEAGIKKRHIYITYNNIYITHIYIYVCVFYIYIYMIYTCKSTDSVWPYPLCECRWEDNTPFIMNTTG